MAIHPADIDISRNGGNIGILEMRRRRPLIGESKCALEEMYSSFARTASARPERAGAQAFCKSGGLGGRYDARLDRAPPNQAPAALCNQRGMHFAGRIGRRGNKIRHRRLKSHNAGMRPPPSPVTGDVGKNARLRAPTRSPNRPHNRAISTNIDGTTPRRYSHQS